MNFYLLAQFSVRILFAMLATTRRKYFCVLSNPTLTAISIRQPMIGSQQHQIYADVDTVVGGIALLSCHISASASPSDSITLILWYRGDDISGAPIYSVDSRHTAMLDSAKHFVSDQYRGRVRFNISSQPAILTIDPVIDVDDGQYWCRVDFKWTRTTISVVTLNVNVPPKNLLMKLKTSGARSDTTTTTTTKNNNNNNNNNFFAKVFNNSVVVLNEGSSATFVCVSTGGKPLPIIHWHRNARQIRHELTHSAVIDNHTVQSELYIHSVNASDLNSVLTCQTSNDNQTFITVSATIDINLRPTSVMIVSINNNRPLLSGMRSTAICQSTGSRPLAVHLWFLSSKTITDVNHTQISDAFGGGKATQSVSEFVATPEDNGAHLICRAENALLHSSGIEDRKVLDVRFAPKVTLAKPGNSMNGSAAYLIRGSELRLQCIIASNPQYNSVVWLHNSRELRLDTRKGILSINATLIVKNASQEWIGLYQCVAHNSEGSGFSNLLDVQVFYPPKCVTPVTTLGATIGQTVTLYCEVNANPANVTFFWYSRLIHKTKPKIVNSGLKSMLVIGVKSADDFGQYSCWAKNMAGNQLEPCLINIYENKVKQLICDTNVSVISISVVCSAQHILTATTSSGDISSDIKQQQQRNILYYLEIYSRNSVIKNITSAQPYFKLSGDELFRPQQTNHQLNHRNQQQNSDATSFQMLIHASLNGKIISDANITLEIPKDFYYQSISDNIDSNSDPSMETSHYYNNNKGDSSNNNNNNNKSSDGNSFLSSRVWLAVIISVSCSLLLVFSIVITCKVCLIWKKISRKRLQSLNRVYKEVNMCDMSMISISTVENLVSNPDVIPNESLNGCYDVTNDILGEQLITDSVTTTTTTTSHANKTDSCSHGCETVVTHPHSHHNHQHQHQHQQQYHQQQRNNNPVFDLSVTKASNRVTVLSDFHANVIDWDSIQVSDTTIA